MLRISVKGEPCLAGVGTVKIVGSATWRPTQPSDGAVRNAERNFGTRNCGPRDCCGASLASHLSTLWSTAENANEKAQAKKASEARAEVRALDQSRGKGAFETSAEFSGRKNKGPRMTTTTEDLHAVVLRAQRAGHTCAFVGADVTVNGKVPDYLLMPPSAAEKFERLHPEAQRLRIEELKIFIENKVKAKREAQIEETENAKA